MKVLEKIRADKRVEEVYSEHGNMDRNRDDWWIHLRAGWCSDPETHLIHQQTLTDCYEELRRVQPCDCKECTEALATEAEGRTE